MPSNDDLVPIFTPALVALLIGAEELNGAPLTRNQVIAIRDNADCVMLPSSAQVDLDKERGCADIDPEDRAGEAGGRRVVSPMAQAVFNPV